MFIGRKMHECLTKGLVYKATLKTDGKTYSYIGLTADTFKKRFSNHVCSFRNRNRPEPKFPTGTGIGTGPSELSGIGTGTKN